MQLQNYLFKTNRSVTNMLDQCFPNFPTHGPLKEFLIGQKPPQYF